MELGCGQGMYSAALEPVIYIKILLTDIDRLVNTQESNSTAIYNLTNRVLRKARDGVSRVFINGRIFPFQQKVVALCFHTAHISQE